MCYIREIGLKCDRAETFAQVMACPGAIYQMYTDRAAAEAAWVDVQEKGCNHSIPYAPGVSVVNVRYGKRY